MGNMRLIPLKTTTKKAQKSTQKRWIGQHSMPQWGPNDMKVDTVL